MVTASLFVRCPELATGELECMSAVVLVWSGAEVGAAQNQKADLHPGIEGNDSGAREQTVMVFHFGSDLKVGRQC